MRETRLREMKQTVKVVQLVSCGAHFKHTFPAFPYHLSFCISKVEHINLYFKIVLEVILMYRPVFPKFEPKLRRKRLCIGWEAIEYCGQRGGFRVGDSGDGVFPKEQEC